jgi:hypothetical protein
MLCMLHAIFDARHAVRPHRPHLMTVLPRSGALGTAKNADVL